METIPFDYFTMKQQSGLCNGLRRHGQKCNGVCLVLLTCPPLNRHLWINHAIAPHKKQNKGLCNRFAGYESPGVYSATLIVKRRRCCDPPHSLDPVCGLCLGADCSQVAPSDGALAFNSRLYAAVPISTLDRFGKFEGARCIQRQTVAHTFSG